MGTLGPTREESRADIAVGSSFMHRLTYAALTGRESMRAGFEAVG
jgi:hypothetical protein